MPQIPALPTFVELKDRIEEAQRFHQQAMPENVVCAWSGYLAALIEWGLISVDDHARLMGMLPQLQGENPVVKILLGHDEEA